MAEENNGEFAASVRAKIDSPMVSDAASVRAAFQALSDGSGDIGRLFRGSCDIVRRHAQIAFVNGDETFNQMKVENETLRGVLIGVDTILHVMNCFAGEADRKVRRAQAAKKEK